MKQLPPGAGKRSRYDKSWYAQGALSALRGSFKMLNDGKWQTMPYCVFAVVYAGTQVHRMWAGQNAEDQAMIIYIPAAVVTLFYVLFGSGDKIMDAWAVALTLGFVWMGFATCYGITLPQTVTGIILTTLAGIPYWYGLKNDNMERDKAKSSQSSDPAPPPPAVGPFEDYPWMKGAEWVGNRVGTRTGWSQNLKLPNNIDATKFIKTRSDGLAGILKIGSDDLDLLPIRKRADLIRVLSHEDQDLLESPVMLPNMDLSKLSVWGPLPIGINKAGDIVYINLFEKHLLLGGESGSGKSNFKHLVVAYAVYDPNCGVWGFDGKKVELHPWRRSFRGYVQNNLKDAVAMMKVIVEEMDWRYDQMNKMGVRNAKDTGMFGPQIVLIDELAVFLRDKEFREKLDDLLNRGRAAGFIVFANTQSPSAKMFGGGDLRRGFTYRVAMRMADKHGSDMVIGSGYCIDASRLDPDCRGLGYLIQAGIPRLFRAYYLPDKVLNDLIDQCEEVDETERKFWSIIEENGMSQGNIAVEDSDCLDVSNVLDISQEWKKKLWESIPEDSYVASSYLEKIVGKTRNPVILELRRLTQAGLVQASLEGSTTKYRKKVSVNA